MKALKSSKKQGPRIGQKRQVKGEVVSNYVFSIKRMKWLRLRKRKVV